MERNLKRISFASRCKSIDVQISQTKASLSRQLIRHLGRWLQKRFINFNQRFVTIVIRDRESLKFAHVNLRPREMIAVALYRGAIQLLQWLQWQEWLGHYLATAANPLDSHASPLYANSLNACGFVRKLHVACSCHSVVIAHYSVTRVCLQIIDFTRLSQAIEACFIFFFQSIQNKSII